MNTEPARQAIRTYLLTIPAGTKQAECLRAALGYAHTGNTARIQSIANGFTAVAKFNMACGRPAAADIWHNAAKLALALILE